MVKSLTKMVKAEKALKSSLKVPSPAQLTFKPCPSKIGTLVLDMDETMLSAVTDSQIEYFDSERMQPDFEYRMGAITDANSKKVKVVLRPNLLQVLEYLSLSYNLVVFTAGTKTYAEPILDHIDPESTLFCARLYREHCQRVEGVYLKDL
jgi:RNA polymerase II subunit A small phosphatase-like protein